MSIDNLLKKFPKKRPELSENLRLAYKKIYQDNRSGKGFGNYISQKLETWMHTKIEKKSLGINSKKCLELGAGNLNHLKYHNKDEIYDIVEPFKELYEGSSNLKRINKIYSDIFEINLKNEYDRILSIVVLEHLTNLPQILEKCSQILKTDGVFQAGIPCEGEFAWYCGWKFGTGIPFWFKYKTNYAELMKYEHVNSFSEIVKLIKYYFNDVKISRSPLPFFLKTKHASFYAYVEAKNKS